MEFGFAWRRPTCADDANGVVDALGPDDQDRTATDRTDRDEALLRLGVPFVENLQVVDAGAEELLRFLETNACLPLFASFFAGSHSNRTAPS
jgi:hypothetical protein